MSRVLVAASAMLGSLALPGSAHAQPDPVADSGAHRGPVLAPHLADTPDQFWSVGVGVERFGGDVETGGNLVGLAAMFRIHSFGPHALLMIEPTTDGYQDWRFLAGIGLRGYFPLLGASFSYGVGLHAEVRLEDHFWLAYATPVELGGVLWRRDSWDIELFVGARRAFAGKLIRHYLIDPNGFDNENAQDELDRLRHDDPWRAFVRLVFARRID
jgi:hypothetical protein